MVLLSAALVVTTAAHAVVMYLHDHYVHYCPKCFHCSALIKAKADAETAKRELSERRDHAWFHRTYNIPRGDGSCNRCNKGVGFE